MMKTRITLLMVSMLWCGAAGGMAGVQVGDSRDDVLERLGPPRGVMQIEEREWMLWDRGTVTFRDGKAVEAKLVSPETLEVLQNVEAQERAQREEINRVRQERQFAEGMERKIAILSDPAYYLATTERQLRIWAAFHQRYPTVDLRDILVDLREQRLQELERAAEQERQTMWVQEIANAETRRAEPEARQADAERRASEAEERLRRQRRVVYVRHPVFPVIPWVPPKPEVPNDSESPMAQQWHLYDGRVQGERTRGTSSTSRDFHGPL